MLLLLLLIEGISSFKLDLATSPTANGIARSGKGLLGGLVGVKHRPNWRSAIIKVGLNDWLSSAKLCCSMFITLAWFGLEAFGLSGAGLFGLLDGQLLLIELVWLGDQLDSGLPCRLLNGLLDSISVSVDSLLIRLLESNRLLL